MSQLLQAPVGVQTNISQLRQKFNSKNELYTFLSMECGAFLPKKGSTNVYFLKDIMTGKKEVSSILLVFNSEQYINRKNVKVSAVPSIKGLAIEDFLNHARGKPDILKYLPAEKDWNHIDKQWLCDVLFTIDTANFENMVKKAQKERQELMEKNKMYFSIL